MYSKSERILISYLTLINKLKLLDYDGDYQFLINRYILESIKDIEELGGKVRLIEDNLLSLIEYDENKNKCRL